MKRKIMTHLLVVILATALLSGCVSRGSGNPESSSMSSGQEQSSTNSAQTSASASAPAAPSPTGGGIKSAEPSTSSSAQASAPAAPAPTGGIELTIALAEEIQERWQQERDAPGGIEEFYQTHPDFLNDQSNRMQINTGKEVEDGGEHARLLLPKGRSPEDDLLNRERLALFVKNYRSKTPDSIVILSSGEPIALWMTVFTYSGGDSYTVQSCYPMQGELVWSPEYTVNQLTETDTEWILLNDPMQKIRFPKYGYEPIPFGEFTGVRTEAEVLALVEQLRKTQYAQQADSVTAVEPQVVDGVPCYVFELQQSGAYTGYSFAVAKTLSRYYEIEQVNGQWVLQARPKALVPFVSTDLSQIPTEWDAEYRNDSLGIAIQFPQSWMHNYTPIFSEQRVTQDEMAIRIDFCYKNDPYASLACVIAMSEKAWQQNEAEVAKNGGPGSGTMAGQNSSYIFAADTSHAPLYDNKSPNKELCDKMQSLNLDAFLKQITIYEPIL